MRKFLLLLALVPLLLGCDGKDPYLLNSYKTLASAKALYTSSMTIAGEMYKSGQITEARKNEIIRVGNLVYTGIGVSALMLVAYYQADSEIAKAKAKADADSELKELALKVYVLEEAIK